VTWSFALERVISIGVVEIERAAPGAQLMLEHPGGAAEMTVVPLPFVS
jgi:glycine cleavage system aminomethyltransferase T